MNATDLAQERFKTGDNSPTYRLEIAGGHFGAELYDATVTYAEDGTSEMSITTDADLSDYTDARVSLEVGYGDHTWPYFDGYLEEPEDDHWGGPSSALAYGPFKALAEASLGLDLSYDGYRLGPAIIDLHTRAGRAAAGTKFEMHGSPNFVLKGEEAALTISSSFADGINKFLAMAGWVSVDRPGMTRLYIPKPKPRPSSKFVAEYSEAHYEPGAFKAIPAKRYGSVGAYARLEDGTLAWPVIKVRVDNIGARKVSENRTYWLEDFSGDGSDTLSQDVARQECGELAAIMSDGVFTWSLRGISANPDLLFYDSIRASTTELRDEGGRYKERYHVVYGCLIDGEVSVNVSREGNPMDLVGNTAIRLSQRKLPKPFYMGRGTTAVVGS